MATADELLAALANSDGTDEVLVIDNNLRTISIPKSIKSLGVESDDEVHRLQFMMPRMCGDVDLSNFNIRINYMNANREGDIYVVTDKKILSSTITFSWLVGRNALAYKGNVNFIVCLKDSDASGNVLREFNTTVASLPVLEGLEVDPAYLEGELHDVLEQLLSLTVAKVAEVEAAGAEQVVKVQQESTKQQENITEHGAQVLATIPADYQTTAKLADEGVRSKADAIIRTAEGKHIEVNDASDDNLRGLKLFGKTMQFTTTGAQLSYVHIQNADFSYLGVTASATADDNILLNGTTTEAIWNRLASAELIAGKTYTLSSDPSLILTVWDIVAGSALTTKHSGEKSITFTAPNTGRYAITLANGAGATFSNTLANIMCNEGKLPLSWEPYCGGIPSPNPDYPQPLVSPGNSGSINTTVAGKNLLRYPYKFTSGTKSGITYTSNDDGSVTYNGTATAQMNPYFVEKLLLKKGTYTISGSPKGSSWETYLLLVQTGDYSTVIAEDFGKGKTFTLNEDTMVNICFIVANGSTVSNLTVYPMLVLGTAAAEYEPYKSSYSITTSTPNGLPGIPVTSGGNHVDENGQQWICDEVDFERGVYVQRVAMLENLSFSRLSNYDVNGIPLYTAVLPVQYEGSADWQINSGYCTHMKYKNVLNGNESGFYTVGKNVFVRVKDLNDDDAFLEAMSDSVFYLNINTPISTPLSASDLASFKAAKTAKPYTQIFNDSDVEMEASYNADTEIYIDNKIAERTPRNSYVAPAIVETKSGEVISVSDSSDDTVRGLKLFGKTTQFTTTGKNLLDKSLSMFSNVGCKKEETETGIKLITLNYGGPFYAYFKLFPYDVIAGKTVTFSTKITTTSALISRPAFYVADADLGNKVSLASGTDQEDSVATFTAPLTYEGQGKWLFISLNANRSTTEDAGIYTLYEDLMLSISDGKVAYEPYTGGKAAPNPDYPQELESVGASGSIGVTVAGKNLLQLTAQDGYTYAGVAQTVNADGKLSLQGTCTAEHTRAVGNVALAPGTYILSGVPSGYSYVQFWVYINGARDTSLDVSTGQEKEFSLTEASNIEVRLYVRNNISVSGYVFSPMIRPASVADATYEPYKPLQTLTASTPNGLPGIPVTSGGNYTDSDGQQWICDEVDFARGVYVQRIGECTITSADVGTSLQDGGMMVTKPNDFLYQYGTPMICNRFVNNREAYCDGVATGVLYLKDGEFTNRYWAGSTSRYHVFRNSAFTDIATAQAWFDSNETIVLYVLATPIETPLTKAELAAYRVAALHTNYPGTTIFNDANAGQEVTYVADTKNWIMKQFAQ